MTAEQIVEALQALVDAATASGEPMSDEDVERYEKLEADLVKVQRNEQIIKRQAAWKSVNLGGIVIADARNEDNDMVARAWDSYLRTGRSNDVIERAQSEGSAAAGGYLVPEGFRSKLVERRKAFGGIATRAEEITTDSGAPLPWPTNDDTANSGAIVAENGNISAGGADLVFGTRNLGAYKYGSGGAGNAPLKLSYELIQDSAVDVEGKVSAALAKRIARKQARDFAVGTGVNEPQGLLSTQGGIAQATAWSSNTAPTYDDLLTTVHDLDPDYREGACWVFNDGVLELVRKMKDLEGRPLLWNSNGALSDSATGLTLMGWPVIVDQACPAPSGGNSFGFFGNLAEAFVIRRVKAIEVVVLREMYAADGQIGYLAYERADSAVQDQWAGVLLKANG